MHTCSGNIHEYRHKLITVILIQLNILLKGTFQFVDMLVQEDSSETCKITSFVIFNKVLVQILCHLLWCTAYAYLAPLEKIYDIQINYVNLNVNTLRIEEITGGPAISPGEGENFEGSHGFSGEHTVFQGITRFFRGSHSFVGVKKKTFFEDFQSKVDSNFDSFRQYFIFFTLILNKKLRSPQIKIKYWSPKNILQIIFLEKIETHQGHG